MAEEEQLRESLKNHPHLTLDELREFKELFNLVCRGPASSSRQSRRRVHSLASTTAAARRDCPRSGRGAPALRVRGARAPCCLTAMVHCTHARARAYTLPCPPPLPVLASRRATQVDEDKGGSISPQELGSLMETLGLKPNQEELDAMIREIDEDGNGEIEFDEFVQVAHLKRARARARGGPLPARHEKLMAEMLGGGAGDVAQSSADLHPRGGEGCVQGVRNAKLRDALWARQNLCARTSAHHLWHRKTNARGGARLAEPSMEPRCTCCTRPALCTARDHAAECKSRG